MGLAFSRAPWLAAVSAWLLLDGAPVLRARGRCDRICFWRCVRRWRPAPTAPLAAIDRRARRSRRQML
jgi:hypothetical protein